MKKTVTLIIAFAMALSLAACGGNKEAETATTKDVQAEAQDGKEVDTEKEPEESSTEDEGLTVEEPSAEIAEPAAEEFKYHYDAAYEGVIITAYNGEEQAIRIPAELDGDPVVCVSSLFYNKNITHIEIPDSVTEIGEGAFSGCSSLTEITIPDSVTRIYWGAFHCEGLKVTYQGQEYICEIGSGDWWVGLYY